MRIRFVDPKPLEDDAPAYVSAHYPAAQKRAVERMEEFDRQPKKIRELEAAVGFPNLARWYASQGMNPDQAVDHMALEAQIRWLVEHRRRG